VEAAGQLVVGGLVAQPVEPRHQLADLGGRARLQRRVEQPVRLGAAAEQRDDVAAGRLLAGDLLIHEGGEARRQRRVLRAQTAAHRLAGDDLAGPVAALALRRGDGAIDDREQLVAGRVVLDALPLGQRHQHAGQLEHRRQVRRRDGEPAAVGVLAQPEVEARALLDRPQEVRHRIDHDGGVRALQALRRAQDGRAHRDAPRIALHPRRLRQRRELHL
jgi:hypothetical protein